jgi:uncharacterized NAD-dependent epimerase/dehydratase family protein
MAALQRPYALFVGDARDTLAAKTALGILAWRPDDCVAQVRLDGCKAELDLPVMTVDEARAAGAATLIVGVANAGGFIPPAWSRTLVAAVEAGFDVASGLHDRLSTVQPLREAAQAAGRRLIDVRHPEREFSVGSGAPRSGRRLLTVGTDCSVGKMYASLAIERALRRRGVDADFRATGQTGIFIAGDGVCVDAVVADFISGATEWLTPAASPTHWDIIEGQGSLFHPSFAGVSLGLLHGAQAEALVLCHEPHRPHMRGVPGYRLPELAQCRDANETAARLTHPDARCIGVAVNTSRLSAGDAQAYCRHVTDTLGLPCVDPMRDGVEALVDAMLG